MGVRKVDLSRKAPILLFLLVLGILISSQAAAAPISKKHQNIQINDLEWDLVNQMFVVNLSVTRGIVEASKHKTFRLSTSLSIAVPDKTAFYGANCPMEVSDIGSETCVVEFQEGGDIILRKRPGRSTVGVLSIPWDRVNGDFTGEAQVTVVLNIQNPGGKTISSSTPTIFEDILIEPSCGDVCPPTTEPPPTKTPVPTTTPPPTTEGPCGDSCPPTPV